MNINKSDLVGKFLIHTSYVPTKQSFLTIVVLDKGMWDFEETATVEQAESAHNEMMIAAKMFNDAVAGVEAERGSKLDDTDAQLIALASSGKYLN